MAERVFRWRCGTGNVWQLTFPDGVDKVFATQVTGHGAGSKSGLPWTISEAEGHLPEIEPIPRHPADIAFHAEFLRLMQTLDGNRLQAALFAAEKKLAEGLKTNEVTT